MALRSLLKQLGDLTDVGGHDRQPRGQVLQDLHGGEVLLLQTSQIRIGSHPDRRTRHVSGNLLRGDRPTEVRLHPQAFGLRTERLHLGSVADDPQAPPLTRQGRRRDEVGHPVPGLERPHEGDDHPLGVRRLRLDAAHAHTVGNRVDPGGNSLRVRHIGGATANPVGHRVRDAHRDPRRPDLTAQRLLSAGGVHQRAVTTLLVNQRSIDLQDPRHLGGRRDVGQSRGEQGVALVNQVSAVGDHPRGDPLGGTHLRLLPLSGGDLVDRLQVQLEIGQVGGHVLA